MLERCRLEDAAASLRLQISTGRLSPRNLGHLLTFVVFIMHPYIRTLPLFDCSSSVASPFEFDSTFSGCLSLHLLAKKYSPPFSYCHSLVAAPVTSLTTRPTLLIPCLWALQGSYVPQNDFFFVTLVYSSDLARSQRGAAELNASMQQLARSLHSLVLEYYVPWCP